MAEHGSLDRGSEGEASEASAQAVLLLAIESATDRASVALAKGADPIAYLEGEAGHHHSERLLPMVDAILREGGVGLTEVGAFAISIGPGAFTSLRIGLATLKGLAFGSNTPAVGVSTLEAMAHAAVVAQSQSERSGVYVPMLDARRGEAYAAIYALKGVSADGESPGLSFECLLPDGVYTPDELRAKLPGDARGVGEHASGFGDLRFASVASEIHPDARSIAALASAALARGEGGPAGELVPRYVRRAEAEVTRTRRRFE